jgi:hypothetical protein
MANIIATTRKNVRAYLKEIYGKNYQSMVQEVNDAFVVHRGSAAVMVSVKPLSKNDCLVNAMAYIVQGAKIGPKILGQLMRWNASNPIGAYGLLFDDTIVFSHSIAGANLDINELRHTIRTVAFVADETDDEIRAIAGGVRAVDAHTLISEDPAAKKPAAKKPAAKKPAAKKPAAKKPAAKARKK